MFIIKLDGGKTMEVDEKTFWHTTSHVMAQAIKRLYKNVKLAIGPAIDNGFYYDIDSEKPFTTEDLEKIEEEMRKIVKEGYSLEYREMNRKDAIKYYEDLGEIYKVEILKDLGDDVEKVSFYKQGEFEDLCKGPHIPTIKPIKAIKLLSVSGAYWRGNEKNKMLQRIYGVSFPKKSMLDEYLDKLKEAKERDHRKIGKEQELFMTHELVGSGLPIFLPNGAVIKRILERYIVDKEIEQGYNHVYSPSLANTELYKISGHWDHYKEDMFPEMKLDNESFVLRPMNCPHHMLIYKNKLHSYRDLPIKIGEMAHDFRYEASGAVTGLERVRQMCQNDAHIFVTRNQIKSVVADVMSLILDVYKDFRISEYKIRLSLRDKENKEKYYDDDEMWEKAESELREIVKESGFEYYEAEGEAAFYGPKLDVQIKTALRT
jgi:threonine--tRNA ligase